MAGMSNEEREKIKDFILQDLHEILHALAESHEKRGWKAKLGKALNSPLAVAFVSGLILTLLVNMWQNRAARLQRNEARRIELGERKQRVLVELADNLARSVAIGQEYKLREAWLRAKAAMPEDKRGKYDDGRDFRETDTQKEKLKATYLNGRMPDSICAQIFTCFQSASVSNRTKILQEKCDRMVESFIAAEIVELSGSINSNYKLLLQQMGDEIRKENP